MRILLNLSFIYSTIVYYICCRWLNKYIIPHRLSDSKKLYLRLTGTKQRSWSRGNRVNVQHSFLLFREEVNVIFVMHKIVIVLHRSNVCIKINFEVYELKESVCVCWKTTCAIIKMYWFSLSSILDNRNPLFLTDPSIFQCMVFGWAAPGLKVYSDLIIHDQNQ